MVTINPARLGLDSPNVILTGRGRRYHVPDFAGPLSIKSVISGRAVWETSDGRHVVEPGAHLVLGHGQLYTITIDEPVPSETFCVFFRRGFVEDIQRALTMPAAQLVDFPAGDDPSFDIPEVVEPDGGALVAAIGRVRAAVRTGGSVDDRVRELAETLVHLRGDTMEKMARLPSLRASTRRELYRRLTRVRARLDETIAPMNIEDMATVACLSPHHFHRLFTRLVGETPHRYAVRKRLERAAGALHRGDDSLLQIALAHGFESLGSFTTLFRRRFGLPPGSWRKKQR
jgi:AraC family transcriptional regulator